MQPVILLFVVELPGCNISEVALPKDLGVQPGFQLFEYEVKADQSYMYSWIKFLF